MRTILRHFIASCALAVGIPLTAGAQNRAIDRANLDTTCAACKDFYQFSNGGWLKKATIPAAYSSFGSFRELSDRNEAQLHKILDADAAKANATKDTPADASWKIGAFYGSCLDTTAIDKLGTSPLKQDLDIIAGIKSADDLKTQLGVLEHRDGLAPWTDGSTQDAKNAASVIAGLYQGGLTLPDKEYYTKTDAESKKTRDSFVEHVARMFELLGDGKDVAAAGAKTVLEVETKFALISKTRVELRDPQTNYHKMSMAELQKLTPGFPWPAFFAAQNAPPISAIDVGQPEFFSAMNKLFTTIPIADWKTYLRWRLVHASAPALSTPIVKENFTFDRVFSGATEMLPRWKRCLNSSDDRLGELLGQEYVKANFTPEAKARALKIVMNLVNELHDRIQHLDWMSAPTKTQALAKLAAFTKKIGFPDKWKDYSTLRVSAGQYLQNVRASDQWAAARDWNKIGKPVDRGEWGMTPPTVNAYYNPQLNEIVFPAGILQPPFYNPDWDDAVNYGAMGAVIGHEMTHGFDDQGRQFDKDGNLKDWWAKEDATKYTVQAQKVVKQFDSYTVLDSATHVNGKLTLGENIADFGGLTVAYAAMEKAIGSGPHPKIDGFTPEQRFFLGWAQVWRQVYRPQSLRTQVNSNEHAPSMWRVDGPLSNMPEFKAAWGCKDGDPMVRPAALRARIW
ncbi:MAG TPA: M13 family metallopeptidase [Gemmatimonadaceae bacterium]|jgi:putative endopeptidase|nr:M13 family metallopeptidase [Gemmatimonadaceae bacterium]